VSSTSQRPSAGARYSVTWAEQDARRVIYRGFVHLPDADLPLEIQIDLPGGATRASFLLAEPGPALPAGKEPAELEKEAAALVRSATKTAVAAGSALPRKIVRWRG
jgi:hypothetical protein